MAAPGRAPLAGKLNAPKLKTKSAAKNSRQRWEALVKLKAAHDRKRVSAAMVVGEPFWSYLPRVRRMLSPASSMRWAL
jgi:uncharacterized membrane protein